MGSTIAEKIIARASGRTAVRPGEYVDVEPDYTVMQELFWSLHADSLRELNIDRFVAPERIVLVIDHTVQAAGESVYTQLHEDIRAFVRRTGFENFFDVGKGGLRHQVMVERGFARPGLLVFSDEPNVASIGAFGAMNYPVSWEVFVQLVKVDNWMRVPQSARVTLHGSPQFGVHVRDLVQAINRDFAGGDALLEKCVEFDGPAIELLSLDDRQGLLAGTYHTGADTAVMRVDDRALRYVEERARGRPYDVCQSDPDAEFALEREYDLSALEPSVTCPPEHRFVVPVGEVAGTVVTQATIGSCGSNRLDDLRAAAKILAGRRLADHVTMYISPGSPEIYSAAAAEGLLQVFSDAGAAVLTPGCNSCWGYVGVLHDGEVAISSQQENYRGRQGSSNADIYLGSPYVVAASAVAGKILDPREMLAETVRAADEVSV